MKLLSVLLLCALISRISLAQMAVASADRNNILFAGIDNPLSIAVEKMSNKALMVKANKGTITRISEGRYVYYSAEYGVIDIIIFRNDKGNLKEIKRIPFRVNPLPDPVAYLGAPQGGNIRKRLSFPQGGIITKFEDVGFEAPTKVISYTVYIISKENCETKTLFNIGNRFSPEVSLGLQRLRIHDVVIIKNILVLMPDGKQRQISPLCFTIEE